MNDLSLDFTVSLEFVVNLKKKKSRSEREREL